MESAEIPGAEAFSMEDVVGNLMQASGSDGHFKEQFSSSAAANIATLAFLGLLMGLKKLCNRPSKCKSHVHCPCIDVEVMDESENSSREVPKKVDRSGPELV